MTCQRTGRPPISTSGFGSSSPRARMRVPLPPQRMATSGRTSSTGDGRQDGDLVTVFHGGVQAVEEANVLPFDVDVHEAAQVAVLGDPLAQSLEPLVQAVEHLADRRDVLDAGLRLAACDAAELGGDLDRDRHWRAYLSQDRGGFPRSSGPDVVALEGLLEVLHPRVDLERLEAVADRVEGLQAVAGDHEDHALVLVD